MRLKIIPNPKKQWAKDLALELTRFLAPSHKIVRKGADATVCIGGDGTILYANYKNRIEGPVLGIGAEKSYICQLERTSWKDNMLQLLESISNFNSNSGTSKPGTVNIMTLECSVGNKTFAAINDVVIHATHYRVAEMSVASGMGQTPGQAVSFEGDGIIISSSIGSTGYAYSAGGEKLRPTERKLVVVPICPYRRAFSPAVLSDSGSVEISVGSDCAFILDGIFVRRLRRGEKVTVRRGRDISFFNGVGKWE